MMKRLLWSLACGGLLGLSWFSPFTFLVFAAFVPLLFLTDDILSSFVKKKGLNIFLYSYLALLVWNIADTWWIWYASEGGAIAAILANTLLMALTVYFFFRLKKRLDETRFAPHTYWLLIPVWLSFEYIHMQWDIAWTWLTLGNVFAFEHNWVQWYEFTGVSGGSMWILAANIVVFQALKSGIGSIGFRKGLLKLAVVIVLPIAVSYLIKPGIKDASSVKINALIVQPNIDPYNDKFNGDFEGQLNDVLRQVKNKLTDKTDYLVLPETFLTEGIWENELERSYSVRFLRDSLLLKYPKLNIVIGASTAGRYNKGEKIPATARLFYHSDFYYDDFNTALQVNAKSIEVYHKSKLVPGVEQMPYPALFKPLEGLAIKLGGTFGSLGTQEERGVFFNTNKPVGVAPVICYESIFGEYVTGYARNGANVIFIITNDGWWQDTPGYRQHLAYARLRAIECRMQIARSANTGISCVVDETGEIHAPQGWWQKGVIMANLSTNNIKTFYVKYGDILSKLALVIVMALLLYSFYVRIKSANKS